MFVVYFYFILLFFISVYFFKILLLFIMFIIQPNATDVTRPRDVHMQQTCIILVKEVIYNTSIWYCVDIFSVQPESLKERSHSAHRNNPHRALTLGFLSYDDTLFRERSERSRDNSGWNRAYLIVNLARLWAIFNGHVHEHKLFLRSRSVTWLALTSTKLSIW